MHNRFRLVSPAANFGRLMELWVFDRNLKADYEVVMEQMSAALGPSFVASLTGATPDRFFVAYRDAALDGGKMNWLDIADNAGLIDFVSQCWNDTVQRAIAARSVPDFRWSISVTAEVKAALTRLDHDFKAQETQLEKSREDRSRH